MKPIRRAGSCGYLAEVGENHSQFFYVILIDIGVLHLPNIMSLVLLEDRQGVSAHH